MTGATTAADPALKDALLEEARSIGFAGAAVADPEGIGPAGRRLAEWLSEDHHGEMGWMADRLAWRQDPTALWPAVRSVVMVADAYTPAGDPLAPLELPNRAAISVYAQGRDYHDRLKKRLKRLGRWLIDRADGEIKVFVDTAPVMEKPLAAAAGLGWQGKHTNLVSRQAGSWLFLGALFTTLKLAPDASGRDHCGTCRRCLDICPTAAFPAPYRLDARRCISYLTIELKGPIPAPMRPLIGNRIYGCDDCLAVCPWNKFADAAHAQAAYAPREAGPPLLEELAALDDATFRARYGGTPIKRIGRARFLRNVAVAIGNSGLSDLAPVAERLAEDEDALVRGHAVWALARLAPARLARLARLAARPETDPFVRSEIATATKPCSRSNS